MDSQRPQFAPSKTAVGGEEYQQPVLLPVASRRCLCGTTYPPRWPRHTAEFWVAGGTRSAR